MAADVAEAIEVAFAYRSHFRKDVIVDLIVYRHWSVDLHVIVFWLKLDMCRGHNELDEPAFTQPLMYSKIRSRRSVPELYEDQLVVSQFPCHNVVVREIDFTAPLKADEIMTTEEITEVRKSHKALLEEKLAAVPSFEPTVPTPNDQWRTMVWPASEKAERNPDTGVFEVTLRKVGRASVTTSPKGFVRFHTHLPSQYSHPPATQEIHPRLKRHVNSRLEKVEAGNGLDWATAEAMAFGSLMLEGYDVRISGQDVGRGTFSQRYVIMVIT